MSSRAGGDWRRVLLILGVQVRLVAAVLIPSLPGRPWRIGAMAGCSATPMAVGNILYLTLLAVVQVLLGKAPMPCKRRGPRLGTCDEPALILVSFDPAPTCSARHCTAREESPYERIDIDLSNKPDWFRAISPLGKVPLLK